jgi:uncharacterized protein YecE (DUF72 family)
MATAWIGTSGFRYRHWRGAFYPRDLPSREWLSYYASRFPTVELNTTFYGLPRRDTVRGWRDAVPDDFRFAVKLSRYGTHLKHLRDPDPWLDRFFDALEPLSGRIGVVLAQLPPHWRPEPDRLEGFLEAFPRQQRLAVEFRDRGWLQKPVYELLRRYGAALCIHDLLPHHPRVVTSDHVYLRFHGPHPGRPYAGAYGPQTLTGITRRIQRHLTDGRDVWAYFDNDAAANAPRDGLRLTRQISRSMMSARTE